MDDEKVIVLDKGCYWLIAIPVPVDELGWHYKGLVWVKGRDDALSRRFGRTVADLEAHAEQFMKCGEDRPRHKR